MLLITNAIKVGFSAVTPSSRVADVGYFLNLPDQVVATNVSGLPKISPVSARTPTGKTHITVTPSKEIPRCAIQCLN